MNKIIVSDEDRNTLQRADVECQSRANLIAFMIDKGMDISSERFQEYQRSYEQAFLAFEQAKTDLQTKYLSNVTASSWSLDYTTCELSYID
jgi:hypothetical protein